MIRNEATAKGVLLKVPEGWTGKSGDPERLDRELASLLAEAAD